MMKKKVNEGKKKAKILPESIEIRQDEALKNLSDEELKSTSGGASKTTTTTIPAKKVTGSIYTKGANARLSLNDNLDR